MKYQLKERFFRYVVVGIGVAIFQFVSFATLFSFAGLHYQLSTLISFVSTVIVSYVSQRHFTYVTDGGTRKNALSVSLSLFLLSVTIGYGLISVVMYMGVEILAYNEYFVQFLGLSVLATYNFFFFNVVFR